MRKSITLFFMLLLTAVPVFCSDESAEIRNQVRLLDGKASQIGDGQMFRAMSGQLGIPVETLEAQQKETSLGCGNIFAANALAKASGQEFSALVQEFQAGKGWGEIGKNYGVKLGPVVSQLRRSNQAAEKIRARVGGEPKGTRERSNQTSRQSNQTQTRNSAGRGGR